MSDYSPEPQVSGLLTVRRRRDTDLPGLAAMLAEQQPTSNYPQNWPLPYPTERFLHRDGELASWVGEIDHRLVGHAAVTEVGPGPEAEGWVAGTGRPLAELAAIVALFVDPTVTGRGVGARLLSAAVEHVRGLGRLPVLDVVQESGAAVQLYRRHGWQVIGEVRPWWLPADHLPVLLMVLSDDVAPGRGTTVPG